ncbi:MAG TPA: CUAEP/CCAEP-tail radical SAM protein [Ktedonobacterales bacterium]
MARGGAILLVATYELGHQPLTLAAPLAALRDAGFAPAARDISVEELTDTDIRAARLVAISTPMHTALRLGMQVAERVRTVNPRARILFYGLYATLNAGMLLAGPADAVIGGEYQRPLLAFAQALAARIALASIAVPGLLTRDTPVATAPALATRTPLNAGSAPAAADKPGSALTPARADLPGLDQYARLARGADLTLSGYVETTRGCLHTCLHCPITPVYGGRFYVNPRVAVLADIRQQVEAGAGHITFGDPDFFNGPGHSMAIARALHAEHPDVTFDATIKIEHLLERRDLIPELAALGCAFIVSAVESLSPTVLARLAKGHTRADVEEALRILDAAGVPMRPTFVAFTPWTSAADYVEVLDFIAAHDLVEHVDPIQYAIRLLVPPGSALLDLPDAARWFGGLDPATLSHAWAHPDPRMDALQREVAALVEREAAAQRTPRQTFAAIRALAARRLDHHQLFSGVSMRAKSRAIPHLTEAWFC